MELNQQVVRLLAQKGLTCAVAESCTGGLVAASITGVSGASSVFIGGVIAYCNALKQSLLGVKPGTLERFTAVSEQTAAEMAQGVRRLTGADIAVSVTGNAGPLPSEGKPVGLVYIGICDESGTTVTKLPDFSDQASREQYRAAAVRCALAGVLRAAEQLTNRREEQ